jgi:hypothetical protein
MHDVGFSTLILALSTLMVENNKLKNIVLQ